MYYFDYSRLSRIAAIASSWLLLGGSAGFAQSVRVFDDAPSIEQLRSIMVPESRGGGGRTIVIQRPSTNAIPSAVQPVATEAVAIPQASGGATGRPSPRAAQAASASPVVAAPAAPPGAERVAEAGSVAFHINFAFSSATLPDSAHGMIDRIAQLMKETPDLKLRVEGHTDAAGPADYNVSLSEERARSVARYLRSQGIGSDRLILVGKGKSEPLTPDPYDAANRRVQFVRIG
jgi:outer membrane protein OmpA-like peptidoglycan-associated protein